MSEPHYLFSPQRMAELVGEEGVDELLAEFQSMVQRYLSLDKPVVGEALSELLCRQIHSLKSATQFVAAEQLARAVIALDKAVKDASLCSSEIQSQLVQLEVQLLEIDQQLTQYFQGRSRSSLST